MKVFNYILGLITVLLILAADAVYGQNMFSRWLYLLIGACLFAVVRVSFGPTNPDRLLAYNASSVAAAGFCAIFSIATGKDIYIDIAIAWALQSYVVTLLVCKKAAGSETDD